MPRLVSLVVACTLIPPVLAADPPTAAEKAAEAEVQRLTAETARAYREGRIADAIPLLEKQLTVLRSVHPKGPHPVIASTYRALGVSRANIGRLDEGLDDLVRGRDMFDQLHPAGHHDTASLLVQIAGVHERRGDRPAARTAWNQSLAMLDKLFPANTHPDGHPTLIHVLHKLAKFHMAQQEYELARPHMDRGATLGRKLYAKTPNPDLVHVVGLQAQFRYVEGKFPESMKIFEEAMTAARAAFPADKFPNGHIQIADLLTELAQLHTAMEAADKSLECQEQSLAMRKKLYPQGGPAVIVGLTNAGLANSRAGNHQKAAAYQTEAVAQCEKLFPPDRFPSGTPLYASCLSNYASVLSDQHRFAESAEIFGKLVDWERKAVAGRSKEYGLYRLAFALNNYGSASLAVPDFARGRAALEECLRLYEERFPPEHYKLGHPQITLALYNLGVGAYQAGRDAAAADYLGRAAAMARGYLIAEFAVSSEAEALDRVRNMPTRDSFLNATRTVPDGPRLTYDQVWGDKALIARALEKRHAAARVALADPATAPQVKANWDALTDVRRQLHDATLNPGTDPAAARARVATLTEKKERLERALAGVLPELAHRPDPADSTPAGLIKRLPPRTAVIDILAYTTLDRDPARPGPLGVKQTPSYTAFVLAPGQPVRRVELGARAPIDAAVKEWRKAIAAGGPSPAAATLRKLLWEPVAAHFPADTETVFLCPDGELSRLPWAALPGRSPDAVLLEDHALAVIPHAPYLLDRLTQTPRPAGTDAVLALGEVRYGAGGPFAALPGTAAELAGLTAAAAGRPVQVLRGTDADVARLRKELPKARYAHLATHAFFNETALAAEPTSKDAPGLKVKPTGSGARNPLAYTGLVLAGANQPGTAAERGVASGETLAELPMENLRLAVLSACETGLGAIDQGEGVQSLTRVFHLAGCPNVVASLWQVNDAATAALMAQFYHELWVNQRPPLAALRQAQLTIYRHPDRIAALSGDRGRPALESAAKLGPAAPAKGPTTPTKLWAAFVLSGHGQ
jgi:CHAT domain-containing protein/tetratricopeptide (TPR) repeat protein